MLLTCLVLVAVAFYYADVASAKYGVDWDYKSAKGLGPANWSTLLPNDCAGSRQSPINIDVSKVKYSSSLKPLVFRNYSKAMPGVTFDIGNNGYTAYARMKYNNTYSFVPIGIEFNGVSYRLAQFHLHWGGDNTRGSEHTIDGEQYPGEMHILHHNVKYADLGTALKKTDGIIAFGNMIKIGKENAGLKHIMQYFSNITKAYGAPEIKIPPVAMSSFIAKNSANYFYYPGSLTIPLCNETITWVLNREPTEMSLAQLATLRSLIEVDNVTVIADNYRPVQPLNDRIVETNVNSSAIKVTSTNLIFLSIFALIPFVC